jgi:small GTP-binding protein
MIQKKICMVGVFGTGKTCLVQQFVHSIFSVKYLSTVGVKIDRKDVQSNGEDVRLMLWDLEGRDAKRDVNGSYVRGAHGIIYVADGTRPETATQILELRDKVVNEIGKVPSIVALNKIDLAEAWKVGKSEEAALENGGMHIMRTSAKTGEGVESTFQWLTDSIMTGSAS